MSTEAGKNTGARRGVGSSLNPERQLLLSFWAVPSGHTAPSSFKFDKFITPYSKAPVRFAFVRSMSSIFSGDMPNIVFVKFAPVRFAPLKSTLKNNDSLKSTFARFAPDRLVFEKSVFVKFRLVKS